MNKNRTMYIINQGSSGVINWAVVYVHDVSYDVYFRDPNGPHASWRKENLEDRDWEGLVDFVLSRLDGTSPVCKVVRRCVVRKFIKENSRDG